jgi:hypothetical protein
MTPSSAMWESGPRVPGAAATIVASALEVTHIRDAFERPASRSTPGLDEQHVQLCFADGSCVSLPDNGSTSEALRAAAAALVAHPAL